MGNPLTTTPAPGSVTPAEPPKAKARGVDVFHVTCAYHNLVGDFDTFEAAVQAAADHLKHHHASAVESKSATAEVEISKGLRFRVGDIEG